MSVKLKRVDVVVLFVEDLARAMSFYRDTLGLQLKFDDQESAVFDMEPLQILLLSIAGAQDLLSSEVVATARSTSSNFQLVSFVEDVDAIYADLVDRGVEFVREPIDRAWGLRTAHFKDPDGNIWEIAQSLSRDSND